MKHDWKYKKLGDICDKGSSNISLNKIEDNIGEYALFGASGYVKDIDFYHNETPYIGIVKDGSGCGRVNIYPAKSSLVGTMQYIYPKQNCDIKFLMYLLQSLDLSSLVTGAAIPHIYFKDYSKFSVPVPPLSTQQSIVSELDSLSKIIADCKETLKDYDALEQSIFYDMFGDPVKNDKGWEVKKLGEVTKNIFAGGDKPKDFSETKTQEYCYPIIANGDGEKGILGYSNTYRVSEAAVTIGARGASIGNCRICREKFLPVVRLITIIVGDIIDVQYLYFIVKKIKYDISGAGQAQLTVPNIVSENIIFPPLPLQQQFASKIEAIEEMKVETKEALQEAETLFQARMDYWFG